MLWFNPLKGFGFIRGDDGERVLVRTEGFEVGHLLGDRCAGTKVEFDQDAIDANGSHVAVHVTVVAETSGRRARSRRHGM
jgi:cold shock CspA family protein